MIIRRPKIEELDKLIELHGQLEHEFPFPDLKDIASLAVAEENGEIIGFGVLAPIVECTLVLDKNKSVAARIGALYRLRSFAEKELRNQGVKQYHAFVQDRKFFNLLKKRFGFKNTKGIALVKVLNG